ncbi:zf-HC2 domain-containing protein [bacterium]|nr:zf-HC2 domain-containing protein [bacterium]
MRCKDAKKRFIALIENKLSSNEKNRLEEHLKVCNECSQLFEKVNSTWAGFNGSEQIKPSPYLWTRLEQRIIEYDEKRNSIFDWLRLPGRWLQPVAAATLIVIGIVIGYYLGNFPTSETEALYANAEEREVVLQDFFESNYLNTFSDGFEGSIGEAYLSMESDF